MTFGFATMISIIKNEGKKRDLCMMFKTGYFFLV